MFAARHPQVGLWGFAASDEGQDRATAHCKNTSCVVCKCSTHAQHCLGNRPEGCSPQHEHGGKHNHNQRRKSVHHRGT